MIISYDIHSHIIIHIIYILYMCYVFASFPFSFCLCFFSFPFVVLQFPFCFPVVHFPFCSLPFLFLFAISLLLRIVFVCAFLTSRCNVLRRCGSFV